jgi:REP element-mobilizing transposase RayT
VPNTTVVVEGVSALSWQQYSLQVIEDTDTIVRPFNPTAKDERVVFNNRKQRLPPAAYRVEGSSWHVVINVARQNSSPFLDLEVGCKQMDSFLRGCVICNATPHLICVMPDHLHLLVEIGSVGLIDLVRRMKSSSTKLWWRQGGRDELWQESFYDHGIRDVQDFEAITKYILHNPVEAGLVTAWETYPLIGGRLAEP